MRTHRLAIDVNGYDAIDTMLQWVTRGPLMPTNDDDRASDSAPLASESPGDGAQAGAASFRFAAQTQGSDTIDGIEPSRVVTGSIDAADPDTAQHQLAAMRLRVMSLEPTATDRKPRAMRGGDFLRFNQQLAYMTEAGLPMEQGLRLIADDLNNESLSANVQRVADELKAGKSLPEAFAAHRGAFPPLYASIIDAGLKTGNLSAVLLGLGRHLELLARLKSAVWRALAYPLVVFVGVLAMLGALGAFIVPQFRAIYTDFDTQLPALTELILAVSLYMPYIAAAVVVVGVLIFVAGVLLRAAGKEQPVIDALLWLPIIGQALRRNMLARWCDALHLGLQAGMDLPGALRVAADTIGSRPLSRDTAAMIDTLERGQTIHHYTQLRFVPQAVPAAIELASHADDLPGMIQHLGQLYQEQAESRVAVLHTVLGPAMLVFVGVLILTVVWGLFLPMISLMESLM
jgi:type IV pilus assembly protein PilC